MRLVANVHVNEATIGIGDELDLDGLTMHCTDMHDGKVTLMWRADPDVSEGDVRRYGADCRRERLASSPKRRTIARARRKS